MTFLAAPLTATTRTTPAPSPLGVDPQRRPRVRAALWPYACGLVALRKWWASSTCWDRAHRCRCWRPVEAPVGGLAADALGARQVGEIMFAVARQHVAQAVLVPDDAIRAAQRALWDSCRLIAEPGGATALAALLSGTFVPPAGAVVGVLVCGGNTDPGSILV